MPRRSIKHPLTSNLMRRSILTSVCCFALLWCGCQSASEPQPIESGSKTGWFRESAAELELRFLHQSGHHERPLFPEIMGGGVALFDMDHDGDLDVYFVQSGSLHRAQSAAGANQLFANRGDGSFQNVTAESGSDDRGYGMGVAAADYDNDGDTDLYVTNVGDNVMLQNDGTGRFQDVTKACGVNDPAWSTSAAFFDADADGDLDLYVCNYVTWELESDLECFNRAGRLDYCNPTSYNAPATDSLFRNNGDGTFTNVTHESGISSTGGNGLGVVCGDFNDDQLIDVFVANDMVNNLFWKNEGGFKFTEQGMLSGNAVDKNGKAKAGMGTCAADVDGDLDLDLLVVNLQAQSDSFFRNEGEFFTDDTGIVGLGSVTRPYTRFGVAWCDFDNDGNFDLFQANGRVTLPDQVVAGVDPFAEENVLLQGDEMGRMQKVNLLDDSFPPTVRTSRAAAFGDLNNDGGLDVVVVNRDGEAEVLLNQVSQENNWLSLWVLDDTGRVAVGAKIIFDFDGKTTRRDVNPHYSYLASNDSRVHLGLGAASRVDRVTVHWIDGSTDEYGPLEANQIHTLQKN